MKFVQNPDWEILKVVPVTFGQSQSSAFGARQKHRIPEGNRKQTKGFPEGIPEGFSDLPVYPTICSSKFPKNVLVCPEAKEKVSGRHFWGKSSIRGHGVYFAIYLSGYPHHLPSIWTRFSKKHRFPEGIRKQKVVFPEGIPEAYL